MDAEARNVVYQPVAEAIAEIHREKCRRRVAAMQELCASRAESSAPEATAVGYAARAIAYDIRAITPEDLDAFIAGQK